MDRRSYLRAAGVAGASGLAGCLDEVTGLVGSAGNENAVLGPPDQERGDPVHPIYGDEFPTISLPDPLLGEEISTKDFKGERAFLMTFIYTNCQDGVCPALLARLIHAQERAAEAGFEDEVAFLAMTFDPERDTAEVLREEGQRQGVDLDAGNWHFLRPETNEEAAAVLKENIGLELDQESLDDHDHGNGSDDHDEDDHDHDAASGDEGYDITHYGLIMLVNEDGYVERSYPNATDVEWETITDDLETVVEG